MNNEEYKEYMRKLRENTQWIKKGLEDNTIILKSNHNDSITNLYNSKDYEQLYERLLMLFSTQLSIDYLNKNLEEFKSGESYAYGYSGECDECGELLTYAFNGREIKSVNFNGNKEEILNCNINKPELEFEIDFPTGKLLCEDSIPFMRDAMKELKLDNQKHSICSTTGIYERTNNYASVNMFHVCVGNTCPSLWKHNDTLAIGRSIENFDGCNHECDNCKDITCEEDLLPLSQDSIDIASICTDLWWATVVDVEVYKSLLIKVYGEEEGIKKLNSIEEERVKTQITPGRYKCTYYRNVLENEDFSKPIIYSKLELIK